jgi:replicative DNA helicase
MSDSRVNPDSLPFSIEKQRAVLGHVLYDERFFAAVVSKLEKEWFGDEVLLRIYGAAKAWYSQWGKRPSIPELLDSKDILKLDNRLVNQIRGTVSMLADARKQYDVKPLLNEMQIWLKARTIQTALPKAANAFNKQALDESVGIMNQMVRDYHDVQFLDNGKVSFLNYGLDLQKEKEDTGKALSFGVSAIDRILEPNGTAGCLMPGQMTVLLAPTNVGKTSTMVSIATANIVSGKSVLFIFHEGTESELKSKFMRCISGMNQPEMIRAYLDPELSKQMRRWEMILERFLVLKPMFKASLTVEEVAGAVELLQDVRRMETGSGFDLLVDDYAAKLTCQANSKGNMQPRQEQENVYNQFVQMGLQHKFHVLTAIQTNREGSKVNRRIGTQKNETRLLHMEDVMETWGAMTAAAIVISLNRSDLDAEMNKLTFLVCKSRNGETGWAVVCNTNYDICRTHSNDMGFFTYRGTESVGERSADIMKTWQGQTVTSDKLAVYDVNPLKGV